MSKKAFDWKNIEFDMTQLSDEVRDEIYIAVSEGRLPIGKIFGLIGASGRDAEVFKTWFENLMEDISDLGTMGMLCAVTIKKAIDAISLVAKKYGDK